MIYHHLKMCFFASAQATTLMLFAASLLSTLLHAVISFSFIVLGSTTNIFLSSFPSILHVALCKEYSALSPLNSLAQFVMNGRRSGKVSDYSLRTETTTRSRGSADE